jgi:hypothetical protein
MTLVSRCLVAGLVSLAGVTAASAADLGRGSIKDSGYEPQQTSRPALFYARGDFTYSGNDHGGITELPNYGATHASVGASRGFGGGFGMYFSPNIRGDLTLDWLGKSSVRGTISDGAATVQGERQFGLRNLVGLANLYYDRHSGLRCILRRLSGKLRRGHRRRRANQCCGRADGRLLGQAWRPLEPGCGLSLPVPWRRTHRRREDHTRGPCTWRTVVDYTDFSP